MFDFAKFGNKTAVITDDGEELTYAQLDALTKVDVPRGLVFCLCENNLSSLIGYLTCIQSSLPVVLLDATKPKETIEDLIQTYKPEYIWDGSLKATGLKGNSINEKLALCLTTSGSTGSPKLVRLSSESILSNAKSIAQYLEITENERPITTLPMYYSYGVSVINSHLIQGATILLTSHTYAQREFWNFIKDYKATSLPGVPYTYEILKKLRFFRMNLPDLTTLTQAGGKLNPDMAKEYIDFAKASGKKFIIMYGQTEASPRMSYLPWESASEKYSSIGIAIPGGKFTIDGSNGQPNVDGELIYEGPNVSLGYAENRSDLAKGDENKGVLHTGDVAHVDEDGFYYITGRLKRFVKIWGNRCNLDAVEQIAKTVTPNCACVGVDDRITIFVTEDGKEQSIIDQLSYQTGLNSRAFEVKFIETIPKNEAGKIQYASLNKLLS